MSEENIQNNGNSNPSSPVDSSGQIQKDLEKKCEEYLNNWKRSAADFINYKKDEIERAGLLINYAKEDIVLKILPILDSIDLAIHQNFPSENLGGQENKLFKNFYDGLLQIQQQSKEFLKKEGIEEIETIGKKFDPNIMEIVEEVEGGESSTVKEELQKGYKMNDKVIRPAKVKVNK